MIYFFKFVGGFVLPPGIFFLFLWGLAIYLWRKEKKRPAKLAAGGVFAVATIFYLMSTSLVASSLMSSLENIYDQPADPQGDVIIMLGGGATNDTPSQGEWGNLTSEPAARLLTTAELYRSLQLPVLLSGGQVYADSGAEAQIARRELMRLGVPENKILIEDKSLNTRQNALYSSRIMRELGLKRPILVTSAFHMERSVLNFAKEDIEVTPYPTGYRCSRKQVFHYNRLMPSTDALNNSAVFIQEKFRGFITRYFE